MRSQDGFITFISIVCNEIFSNIPKLTWMQFYKLPVKLSNTIEIDTIKFDFDL